MIGSTGLDQAVLDWFVDHREPWLNTAMQVVTTLGSSAFLIPLLLAVSAWYWRRHRTYRPFTLLALAYGGSYVVSQSIKVLVGRPRPPAGLVIGHYSGYAFPSGHATEAAAVYGMLAVVLAAATLDWRRKVAVWATATVTVTLVGITRLYLAAHWLTDVLGGWCFGTLWFLLVLAVAQVIGGRPDRPLSPVAESGSAGAYHLKD
jgi:undecaprenyl-diphosphatase